MCSWKWEKAAYARWYGGGGRGRGVEEKRGRDYPVSNSLHKTETVHTFYFLSHITILKIDFYPKTFDKYLYYLDESTYMCNRYKWNNAWKY